MHGHINNETENFYHCNCDITEKKAIFKIPYNFLSLFYFVGFGTRKKFQKRIIFEKFVLLRTRNSFTAIALQIDIIV